jgi:predicted lipoprotein with Yx(FWY)xxD motif
MSKQTLTRAYLSIVGTLVLAGAVAAVALARGSQAPTLGSASNATLATHVVVSSQGRTLYALTPETSRRLLCRSAACLHAWPPLTVASARIRPRAAAGVHGQLGLVRRSAHSFQVTLRGMPLYRFSGDRGSDESNGQAIKSFGGTWHAVTASGTAAAPPMQPTSTGSTPAPYSGAAPQAPSAPAPPSTPTQPVATPPTTTSTTPTTTPTYTYPAGY